MWYNPKNTPKRSRKRKIIKFYIVMCSGFHLRQWQWNLDSAKTRMPKNTSADMKFFRETKGCTLRDQNGNDYVRTELNIFSMNNRIRKYALKWRQHIERMNHGTLITQVVQYKRRGRRNVGRLRSRWQDRVRLKAYSLKRRRSKRLQKIKKSRKVTGK